MTSGHWGFIIDIEALSWGNSSGKVPFMLYGKPVYTIDIESKVPKYYIYNGRVWHLRTGQGSTYYIPNNIALPGISDGPIGKEYVTI